MHLALTLFMLSVAPMRDDAYVLPAGRTELISVLGPATVTLTLAGFVKKAGKRVPVKAVVRGGIGGAKTFVCAPEVTELDAPKRPAFVLTEPHDFIVSVGPGVQSLSVRVVSGAGASMLVRVQRDIAAIADAR